MMAVIRIVTTITAPVERCFDLARDIDFHTQSLSQTKERAVAGRTTGLIELGESVTWEARHLGVRQRLTSQITAFQRPTYFRDVMTAGAFRSFAHDHRFEAQDGYTVMTDEVEFRSPLGPPGLAHRPLVHGPLPAPAAGRPLSGHQARSRGIPPVAAQGRGAGG
jgi:ligand-binding SRPBCC domain-containing protein